MAAATHDPERPDPEKIEYLRGQVNALFAFFAAAIRTHPDPTAWGLDYVGCDEWQQANALPSSLSDVYLEGQRDTRIRLHSMFEAARDRAKGGQ